MKQNNIIKEYYNKLLSTLEQLPEPDEPNYFIKFLLLYYNIQNLEDCINWCNNNLNVPKDTINRILNMTWEVLINSDNLQNEELMDKFVTLYVNIYKKIYKIEIDYSIMDKILREIGMKLLGSKLLFNTNNSYQKEIKKSIYNNINK
jgi:hypothetical protein